MISYPSIPYYTKGKKGTKVWVFDKPDGNNLRFQWSKNRGFYKYGSRTTLIDTSSEYSEGIDIFLSKYSNELDYRFRNLYPKDVTATVFSEYYGDNSFSGQHKEGDIMDVKFFDICIGYGFLPPSEYIEKFGDLDIVPLLDITTFDELLIQSVYENKFKVPLKEGVICKGEWKSRFNNNRLTGWACKIKTKDWLIKVKEQYGKKILLSEVNGDDDLIKNI